MTRAEHLEWCKKRAREYLDQGNVPDAIASMLSDLGKHSETSDVGAKLAPLAMFALVRRDVEEARQFIEGFR